MYQTPYPDLADDIKKHLLAVRETGVTIQLDGIRAIMIGMIHAHPLARSLFVPRADGSQFLCGKSFVRRWV